MYLFSSKINDKDGIHMSYLNLNIYFLVFLQAYYLLNTSLKTVPEIHAYDKDTGINQTINYKIHKGLLGSFFSFYHH